MDKAEIRAKARSVFHRDPRIRRNNYLELHHSDFSQKARVYRELLGVEDHPQLKEFLLRQVQEASGTAASDQAKPEVLKRIQLALQSNDEEVRRKAIQYVIKNQFVEAFELIARVQKQAQTQELALALVQLASCRPGQYKRYLVQVMGSGQSQLAMLAARALFRHNSYSSKAFVLRWIDSQEPSYNELARSLFLELSRSDQGQIVETMKTSNNSVYESCAKKLESIFPERELLTPREEHSGVVAFDVISHFKSLLSKSNDKRFLSNVLMATGGLAGFESEILPLLKEYFAHEEPRIRASAVEAFLLLCSREEALRLIELSKDGSSRVVANLSLGLWKQGLFKESSQVFKELLKPDLGWIRSANYVIQNSACEEFIGELRRFYLHESRENLEKDYFQEGIRALQLVAEDVKVYKDLVYEVQQANLKREMGSDPVSSGSKKNSKQKQEAWKLSPYCKACYQSSENTEFLGASHFVISTFFYFGTILFPKTNHCKECDSYATTLWFTFIAPVFPRASYRVIWFDDGRKSEVIAARKIPLPNLHKACALLSWIALICLFVFIPKGDDGDYHRGKDESHREFEQGLKYMGAGEYSKAIPIFEYFEKEGVEEASINLGAIYVDKNNRKFYSPDLAINHLKNCAGKGYTNCELNLANAYIDRNASEQDRVTGLRLLEEQHKKGSGEASFDLGYYYLFGSAGLNQDRDQAARYFKVALKKGKRLSAYYLANIAFNKGHDEEYKKWIRKGADLKDLNCLVELHSFALFESDSTEAEIKYSLEQLNKYSQADRQGIAAFRYGVYCLKFRQCDTEESMNFLDLAAQFGNQEAISFLETVGQSRNSQ